MHVAREAELRALGSHTYSFCDIVVASSLPFPELPAASSLASSQQISFDLLPDPFAVSEVAWERRWEFPDKSAVVYSTESSGDYRYRLDSIHGPRFFIAADGHRVSCDRWQGDEDTVRHLFADQVLPRILSHQGSMMVHAACIETVYGAVAIFGESGRGKSTLSYALQCLGCKVLSDDCIKLVLNGGQYQAIPTYPSLRLWPDVVSGMSVESAGSIPVAGYNNKRRIDVTKQVQQVAAIAPVDLSVGIILEEPLRCDRDTPGAEQIDQAPASLADVRLRSFEKRAAMMELLRQTFHLDVRDRDNQQRAFDRVEQFVRALPFFGLTYSRTLKQMPTVAAELIERIRAII